jgi:hypothetical protein
MNILSAIDDPNLLGHAIRDPSSWRTWRAMLASAFGLPLDEYGLELFKQCTGRTVPPAAPVNSLYLVCGRRAGKSFCMALTACYLAIFCDWQKYLSPGERAVILLIAGDREQARILHRYCQGILLAPILQNQIWNTTANEIEIKGKTTIEIGTRSYRAVRGRSICAALLDESAFWRSDDSANPDSEVVAAVRPSMATFPGAMLITASSPYAKRGILWDAHKRYFGKDDHETLVWVAPTRVMNPSVPQSFIDSEFERDPASANSEYNAEFRNDIAAFIDRDIVEGCVDRGVHERLRLVGHQYVCFIDSAGGSGSDSFTGAIAHKEGNVLFLDAVREYRPPFSPKNVVEEIAHWMKSYGVSRAQSDKWGGDFPIEEFAVHLIRVEASAKPKSDLYIDALPMLNSGKCRLLDNSRLVLQLCGLERRTARGGRDSIDHAPGMHDDVANAVAGALILAAAKTQMKISDAILEWSRNPAASMPRVLVGFEGRMQ